MRVKRLEIQGFKSFKDKTVIHFDHGITGIVGPNGCGKSNIVDAFFWVMGEQSYKHMRGSGSDDLIFNGSSKYSPLGLAEATIVMETDAAAVDSENAPAGASARDLPPHLRGKEVSVTRRLYRGGEGEYFINGVQARLKDVHELFMDTGVGAKGYSIIEQGQIGKIVNSKPEERRLLIEEAAGIAKYKARKKESLRKMEAAQLNLGRLNDVIQEIERSLGSLERQAQKARQYKKYKDELLDKEMTWGRRKHQVIRQRLEALKKERDAVEQELIGLRAELSTAETAIETDRINQLTDGKAAEELQTKIQILSDELTRERSALELSRQRQSDLTAQRDTLEREKSELMGSITTERETLSQLETEAGEIEGTFQAASAKAQEMDERARKLRQEADMLRRQVDLAKRELMDSVNRTSDLTSKSASLLSRMESAEAQTVRLSEQRDTQSARLQASQEEATRAQETAQDIRSRRETLQAETKTQSAQTQTLQSELRTSERERDQSLRNVTQLKSRLESLEELAAAHEGFGDGPKAALDWARDTGAKIFALADTLEVSAGYESAVEGLLENRLESLIAEETSQALEAIAQIRGSRQGRVAIHVSPSTASHAVGFDEIQSMLTGAGFAVIGELKSFVKTNHVAADRAIAQVCVVENFDSAPTFISGGGTDRLGGWIVLSRDGSALDGHGVLRGGSTPSDGENEAAGSLLRHRRAIAELRSEVAAAEATHVQIEIAVQESSSKLEAARDLLEGMQADLQSLEIQAAALDRDVHQMTRAVRENESQLAAIERELEHAASQVAYARKEREAIEAQLSTTLSRRQELEASIASSDSELSMKDTDLRAQESEVQTLKVNEAQLRERSTSLKRELEGARSLLNHRQRRVEEIDRVLDRTNRESQEFVGGESVIEAKIGEVAQDLAENRELLSIVKDRLEQSSAKLNSTLDLIKELHKNGDERTAQANQMSLEVEKLNGELSHLIQNLEEKYGPGCLERPVTSPVQEEMTEPVVTAEMTAEEEQLLGEEVERLRERIRRLGEVNVMAIEEFEELKKRYDYLVAEKLDLERSIENLEEAIEHINKTSEERFKKAFEAISDRFERLFPIIFGGGQAKLSLVYPEGSADILDAGVDILAQPPGKKVVNIGLLSGGEKALTAVSLIFAIFMVKPSPFCVLDEVDAPLDDANIGKFNALLREMSAKSQFILITHNKKTMELNDTLYGVTMEEPGVSKMVSIEMH